MQDSKITEEQLKQVSGGHYDEHEEEKCIYITDRYHCPKCNGIFYANWRQSKDDYVTRFVSGECEDCHFGVITEEEFNSLNLSNPF